MLATYNGAAYLPAQLDSLLAQTHKDWRVIARDDGSSDGSLTLLETYARNYPGQFEILRDEGRAGAKISFSRLIAHSSAPYVAFCDQDDVWKPEKLELLLEALCTEERHAEPGTPMLAHCDLQVVDESLELMNPSFWVYQGIDPFRDDLSQLLVQNVVTGCAMLCNRALVDAATPIPESAFMHDYWLALIASALGRIVPVRHALIQYRQHGRNTLGAKKMPSFFSIPARTFSRDGWPLNYTAACAQADALVQALAGKASDENLACAEKFAQLYSHGWWMRRWVLVRYGIFPALLRRHLSVLARV
ncbi:glycosyltransferase family 2 protein [Uliginosibacterium sp. H3]|uniref:Glycosyltransferase family 2 protein n=1 Tax=Uliginosibacterium silvisoli TaxID=3114758 RepID=A0ABU6K0X4_9RHOO|nr:glycosyltransferase family 2 protein [Uliginosibacterium sp. H3]